MRAGQRLEAMSVALAIKGRVLAHGSMLVTPWSWLAGHSQEGFEIVAAAGGDGTVHEVANGLLQAGRPEVCFAVLPLGSADDYAYSLKQDRATRADGQGPGRLVDVGVLRTDRGDDRYFVCCLGLGFGPCVTIESREVALAPGTAPLRLRRALRDVASLGLPRRDRDAGWRAAWTPGSR